MSSRTLHIFQTRLIVQGCGDERRTHGVRRVPPAQSNVPRVLLQYPVNHVRMQVSAALLLLAISSPHRAER
jgi:hypothetical protein